MSYNEHRCFYLLNHTYISIYKQIGKWLRRQQTSNWYWPVTDVNTNSVCSIGLLWASTAEISLVWRHTHLLGVICFIFLLAIILLVWKWCLFLANDILAVAIHCHELGTGRKMYTVDWDNSTRKRHCCCGDHSVVVYLMHLALLVNRVLMGKRIFDLESYILRDVLLA